MGRRGLGRAAGASARAEWWEEIFAAGTRWNSKYITVGQRLGRGMVKDGAKLWVRRL